MFIPTEDLLVDPEPRDPTDVVFGLEADDDETRKRRSKRDDILLGVAIVTGILGFFWMLGKLPQPKVPDTELVLMPVRFDRMTNVVEIPAGVAKKAA